MIAHTAEDAHAQFTAHKGYEILSDLDGQHPASSDSLTADLDDIETLLDALAGQQAQKRLSCAAIGPD